MPVRSAPVLHCATKPHFRMSVHTPPATRPARATRGASPGACASPASVGPCALVPPRAPVVSRACTSAPRYGRDSWTGSAPSRARAACRGTGSGLRLLDAAKTMHPSRAVMGLIPITDRHHAPGPHATDRTSACFLLGVSRHVGSRPSATRWGHGSDGAVGGGVPLSLSPAPPTPGRSGGTRRAPGAVGAPRCP